ncbi:hypothetical protein CDN99_13520 [Roseateles aquatilis]|uniref:Response regulatory domain-containing protein n=1 Tax=Roseateles aquatilis TaxID=431061 RepID=A0A246JCH8_9BURK|nr:response regulator [Roseateles aquatilis]OWQ90372.1 hypothetical protein CDN99_13520 [Roseateles aquatilis]
MSKTVLIVDDSRMSRMILQSFLSQLIPDLQLHQAGNGDEAVALAALHRFDVVSMDLNMPGRDGIETALAIRAVQPDVPIALLTANVQAAVQERAAASGLHFLPKPIGAETAQQLLQLAGGPHA